MLGWFIHGLVGGGSFKTNRHYFSLNLIFGFDFLRLDISSHLIQIWLNFDKITTIL